MAEVARSTGLTRQTVYRIKDDPGGEKLPWRPGAGDFPVATTSTCYFVNAQALPSCHTV
jgi:hypothetical protein